MSLDSIALYFLAFAGAALLLAIVPGPSMAVIVRQTLRHGRGAGFAATLANEVGLLFWALVASLGLSVLVAASEAAYDLFRIVGAVVLIWLGIQSWLDARLAGGREQAPTDAERTAPSATGHWSSFRVGLVTILANPKAAVFAASFLPQFVPPDAPVLPTLVALSIIWVIVDTVWWVAVAWAVHRAQRTLSRPGVRRRLEEASGGLLVGLGLRLAVEHR
jgi:threonine/homoserine/homoserine lactone efflux protein